MDEKRFRREALDEQRRMRREAKELWRSERAYHVHQSGPGFLRHTDKQDLGRIPAVVDRALEAGCEWRDIEAAIKVTAAAPFKGPFAIFDAALVELARREDQERIERKKEESRFTDIELPRLGRMP